jgi:hypothetical protein
MDSAVIAGSPHLKPASGAQSGTKEMTGAYRKSAHAY